ncbi:MAG: HigA family addiction module antidote protein [Alphaproteobacteria bacterium]|nr:HigA family addiction module antidote protein [Alphaproteobacteria bacterium]
MIAHPGELLALELKERDLSANAFALAIRVPANRIAAIVKGERAVTPETALRIARYFGTDAGMWLRMQADFDLAVAERKVGAKIRKEVLPVE